MQLNFSLLVRTVLANLDGKLPNISCFGIHDTDYLRIIVFIRSYMMIVSIDGDSIDIDLTIIFVKATGLLCYKRHTSLRNLKDIVKVVRIFLCGRRFHACELQINLIELITIRLCCITPHKEQRGYKDSK